MTEFFSMHISKFPYKILLNLSFLFLISCLTAHLHSSNIGISWGDSSPVANYYKKMDSDIGCKGIQKLQNKQEKCSYVKSNEGCKPRGYIPYLQLFYCTFSPVLGCFSLALWLVLLFYLLGDTASNYFCYSLVGLSKILKLSPTIAGVSLLSLGNGAPDVFASIISFTGDGTKDIGLNSILGAGFFVSCVVVGIISISVSNYDTKISRPSFIRDVIFLLLSLSCLVLIIIVGKISLWGALSFLSLYLIYVFFIFTCETCSEEEKGAENSDESPSIFPDTVNIHLKKIQEGSDDAEAPLFRFMDHNEGTNLSDQLEPQTADQKGIDHEGPNSIDQLEPQTADQKGRNHKGPDSSDEVEPQTANQKGRVTRCVNIILCILELPLELPRRLTIPVVSEDRWSKPLAVVSVTLAPIALALTWNFNSRKSSLLISATSGAVGIACGILVFCTTERLNPPRKCLLLWLAGAFVMSMAWTYILAQELISLLVSLGLILGIDHSILGLTVLAWGNSVGDMVANVTMAKKCGPEGAQLAISGSYAGPIFNTVVGLGLSLALSTWTTYPATYAISVNHSVFTTIGLFIVTLIWALVILPKRMMRPDKCLGIGLLAIYLCFLSLQMARSFGLVQIHGPPFLIY
ncbi:hypothetical protein Pfo_003343 [Paulownia fortunei]|nr:hypothetical protein Pfo_003343 [Paulownia fortunei]